MNIKQWCALCFPLFYWISGPLYNPYAAVLFAGLYEMALIGLVLVYQSAYSNPHPWPKLLVGFFMLFTVYIIFENFMWR